MRLRLAHRRLRVPVVRQISAMDCGPTALGSLPAGWGVRRRLAELRAACQAGIEGNGISDGAAKGQANE